MQVSRDACKLDQPSDQCHGQLQHYQFDFNHLDHEYYVIDFGHQPEYDCQPECHRLPGDDSAGYSDGIAKRQQHKDHPESADPSLRRTESYIEDRRSRAGGDGIVPAGYWRSGYHLVNTQFQYLDADGHHAAGACGRGDFVEDDAGRLGGDIAMSIGGIDQPVIGQRRLNTKFV